MANTTNTPSDFEQLLFEYTNRARMNPEGEHNLAVAAAASDPNIANALNFFGVDLDAYETQMQAYQSVAPLAWDTSLAASSDAHSQLMIDLDTQSHNLPGEASLGVRITNAGYSGWTTLRENVYAYSQDALFAHLGFMIDWGYDDADFNSGGSLRSDWQDIGDGIQDPAGHRLAILAEDLRDVGISAIEENDASTGVGPWVVTQNFGTLWGDTAPVLLGVFIDDHDGDAFYDIGEGIGGVTVTATNTSNGDVFTTTTWGSGGYQIDIESGTYQVEFSGVGLDGSANYAVTIGTDNVKLDGFAGDVEIDDVAPNVVLADGFEALYFADVSAQVYRLYLSVLGREPDSAGHLAWTERLAIDGQDLNDVANAFIGSPEFQSNFGALDNEAFVTLMYQNVLEREPDAAGLARWVGDLGNGVSRTDVVLGFSDSSEFITNTASAALEFGKGQSPSEWGADVFRLYQATLNRAPDANGFENWSGRLGSGSDYLDVVDGFVSSAEFQATYGDLDNAEFVTLLYANVLNRAPDDAGLTNWTTRLDAGETVAEVVKGFAQSAEFVTNTQDNYQSWVLGQGIDDEVHSGAGDSILAGGLAADSFIFNSDANDVTVLDLEAWDYIDLSQFSLSTVNAALDQFQQQGQNVVFEGGDDTTVTFLNADLALITDDMILI